MLKQLAGCIREYKRPTILTLIFIVGEAVIETIIPFITANLVNRIKAGASIESVMEVGLLLIIMAAISLVCGGLAGFTCAKASTGFAKNLRSDLFHRIQTYSFENIDKFSSSSLVTRMTTDVTNVQMAFMMLIRIAIRSPLLLIFSTVMAFVMGGKLAFVFVVVIPILAFGLLAIGKKAMPAFRSVFKKYDRLNESIEENVRGMRVVKGFSREEYEKQKFNTAADNIRKDFTKAECIVALNTPLMNLCVYINMVVVLLVGSKLAITSGGSALDVGQISGMLTYGMQILMSLMMLSMIYVMVTMSAESAKRICEVLEEEPSLKEPENPVMEVKDGSIEFKNVNFKYSARAKKYALSDIDLSIRSGMTVGIIGGTGSSKSSLVQLIPRLYDVTEGAVLVGGVGVGCVGQVHHTKLEGTLLPVGGAGPLAVGIPQLNGRGGRGLAVPGGVVVDVLPEVEAVFAELVGVGGAAEEGVAIVTGQVQILNLRVQAGVGLGGCHRLDAVLQGHPGPEQLRVRVRGGIPGQEVLRTVAVGGGFVLRKGTLPGVGKRVTGQSNGGAQSQHHGKDQSEGDETFG